VHARASAGRLSRKRADRSIQSKLAKELGPGYGCWLNDEVPYIITDEERDALRYKMKMFGLSHAEEEESPAPTDP